MRISSTQLSVLRARGCLAFTLTELMTASGIAIMVVGSVMLLLIESAKEQRRGMADATVEEFASDLQSQVMGIIRSMNATEGIVYTSPATNSGGGFWHIIVARGATPDYPREELYFNPANGQAIYDPNRAIFNDEQVLLTSRTSAFVLRNLCFKPSIKADSTVDNSFVNVLIDLDDNGSSGRRASVNPAHVQRTFSVKMRNN
jgi:hypothetical protein